MGPLEDHALAAAKTLTPSERTLRARSAALALHAGGGTNTTAARAAMERRFEDEVDPDRTLPEAERARRAALARRRYYVDLAYRSARARRARAEASGGRQRATSEPDTAGGSGDRGSATPTASAGSNP